MTSWDEIIEFYTPYARFRDARDRDFGNGMLELIHLLKNDPDINSMSLGTSMNWLVVASPNYDIQSVHIQWFAPDTYEIFLTPEINEAPDITVITLSEAVPKVKEYLCELREKGKKA